MIANKNLNFWKISTLALGTVLFIALGVWFYLTPYLAYWNMRTAAQNRDAETFCSYIDFPVFRENLKSELNAKMLSNIKNDPKLKDNPFSGLAYMAAPAMVNNMVDALVSPAGIERAFKGEYSQNRNVTTDTFNKDFMSEENGEVVSGYNSVNEFIVLYKPTTGEPSKLIFQRQVLWDWKLINMKFK